MTKDTSTDKAYFECHITFTKPKDVKPLVIDKWKFSSIDGDPVLGAGIKSYYTRQYPASFDVKEVVKDMDKLIPIINKEKNHKVLRTKVELVLYDNRIKQ